MILEAIAGSFLAGIATGIGGIPLLFGKKLSSKTQDILLGFSAGIMLSASFFSLLLPAIELSENVINSKLHILAVSIFFLAGGLYFFFWTGLFQMNIS